MADRAAFDPEDVEHMDLVHVAAMDIYMDEERNTRCYADHGTGRETSGTADDHYELTDEQLVDDIAAHGLLQPIGVRIVDDGYHCIYGFRRLRACLHLADDYPVPCIVHPQTGDEDHDDFEADAANLRENMNRRRLKPFELAEALYRMRERRPELSIAELAAHVGLSDGYARHLVRIRAKAAPELWRLFVAYGLRFSSNVSYLDLVAIVRLPRTQQVAAWHALIERRHQLPTKNKKGGKRMARATTIRKWLAEAEHLEQSTDFVAGVRFALRAALGMEPWPKQH